MELLLNLAWMMLATAIIALWLLCSPRGGVGRLQQLLALAVLSLILFPVISITDDLLAAQNPAEADCCLRKDHVVSSAHSVLPALGSPPERCFAGPTLSFLRSAAPCGLSVRAVDHPGLAEVQNRPPPTA
jgi:hypothetical protein